MIKFLKNQITNYQSEAYILTENRLTKIIRIIANKKYKNVLNILLIHPHKYKEVH